MIGQHLVQVTPAGPGHQTVAIGLVDGGADGDIADEVFAGNVGAGIAEGRLGGEIAAPLDLLGLAQSLGGNYLQAA